MAKLCAVTIAHTGMGNAGHRLHTAFADVPQVTMVAVSDPDPDGRAKFAKESGAKQAYADYTEMLAKEKPDIVVVGQHWYDDARADAFVAAIESGAKGIFCEKPIAAWPYQADKMLAAVRKRKIPVVMAHRSREHPTMQRIKDRAAGGEWGPLIQAKAHGKGDSRTGAIDTLVLGTHELDAMLFMVGESPESCWGTITVKGRPAKRSDAKPSEMYGAGMLAGDRLFAQYLFPGGVVGTYESLPVGDGSYGGDLQGLDLYYQNAVVTTRGRSSGQFHVYPCGSIFPHDYLGAWERIPTTSDWIPDPQPFNPSSDEYKIWRAGCPPMSNRRIAEELVACIAEGREPCKASSIHDAAKVLDMIVGAHWSHLEGIRVDLPLVDRRNPWTV